MYYFKPLDFNDTLTLFQAYILRTYFTSSTEDVLLSQRQIKISSALSSPEAESFLILGKKKLGCPHDLVVWTQIIL